jgi:hypothetical protein
MMGHLLAGLLKSHGIQHHAVNIDVHSGNPVERTIKTILGVYRKLLSELRLPPEKWSNLANAVTRCLNNTPSDRLDGRAPIQAFLNLERQNSLGSLIKGAEVLEVVTEQELADLILAESNKIITVPDPMGIQAQHVTNRKRVDARAHHTEFVVGDYCLLSRRRLGPKLRSTWTGPYSVSNLLTEHILELKDVRTGTTTNAHISRVHKFADNLYEVDAPVLSQSVYYSVGNEVVTFKEARLNEFTDIWELLTEWLGVEVDTWEPAAGMAQDAPSLVRKFCDANKNANTRRMIRDLNLNIHR